MVLWTGFLKAPTDRVIGARFATILTLGNDVNGGAPRKGSGEHARRIRTTETRAGGAHRRARAYPAGRVRALLRAWILGRIDAAARGNGRDYEGDAVSPLRGQGRPVRG